MKKSGFKMKRGAKPKFKDLGSSPLEKNPYSNPSGMDKYEDQQASLDAKMSYSDEYLKKAQDEYRSLKKTRSSGGKEAYEKRQNRLEELKQILGAGRHQRKYPKAVGREQNLGDLNERIVI